MKKIIIMTLLFASSKIYAHSIEANIMDIYEPDSSAIQRDGFISMQQQKNLERYQMEVKQLKKENQERLQNQFRKENNMNDQMYQDMIDRHSNQLMTKRSQNGKKV